MKLILPDVFTYSPIPRCGDEEISLLLQTIDGVDEYDNELDCMSKGRTFSIIRNPFELVRIWFDLNPGWEDFQKFIKEYNHSHFAPGGKLFWIEAEDYIKYEALDDGILIEYLIDTYNINVMDLPTMPKTDYRDHYEPETIELVRERFGAEIDLHDYTF